MNAQHTPGPLSRMRVRAQFWQFVAAAQSALLEAAKARLDGRTTDWLFCMSCAASYRRHASAAIAKATGGSHGA